MATYTVDELVKAAEQLPQTDLENLTAQVLTLKARRTAPELSKNEAELLRNINRGMPDELQNRYRELIAIRRAGTLTESEHAELLHLTNQVEKHDTERLKYLTELARIRKISLTDLLTVERKNELRALLKKTQSLPQIQTLIEEDILAEIEAYRKGQ